MELKVLPGADAADGAVGGRDEGVGAQVDVQQGSVRSFDEDALRRVQLEKDLRV